MAWSGFPVAILSVVLLAVFRHVTGSFPLLCGQELVNAVATVCDERGYYGQPSKRSANIFELETRAKTFLKSSTASGEHRRSKRRVRTGLIVTECCLNRCSITHLESYCNPLPEGAEHDPEIHVRPEKSAEEDPDEERPQDGQGELDAATEVAPETTTSETRGRNRLGAVEKVISNRLIPTSADGSSPTPSRKKPRKDKSERRQSSREAKQARREERRRNRERSSGGRSRSGRRKNKDNDRASRAKRNGLTLWRNMFSNEDNFHNIQRTELESQRDPQSFKGSAPSPFTTSTLQASLREQHGNKKNYIESNFINEDEDKRMQFSTLMSKLRTLVLNYPDDR